MAITSPNQNVSMADEIGDLIAEGERLVDDAFNLETTTKRFVSVAFIARYLDCDRRTIVRMIKAGALPATRAGRAYRIPTDKAREAFHVEAKRAS
jgi:excisionase family DNA binding protein